MIDVGKLIKSYRTRIGNELGILDGQDFDELLAHQVGGFLDGTKEESVHRSSLFLPFI
jgi:hypothetical protein